MRCSRCGTELPDDARFCSSCGASVAGPVAEERKFVSVLFVDVVGSTARADGADPEDVRDRNQRYYREVRDRIERHGGDDREVRRRCGDGRVRGTARAERRRGASGSGLLEHHRGHRGDERTRPQPRSAGACRGLHRRGDRVRRRRTGRRPRHGRRGQHGGPPPVCRPRGASRRRRGDVSPHASRVRLPGTERRRRERQARSGAGVARGTFARVARRATDVDDTADRARTRSAADPNGLGSRGHRRLSASGHGDRSRGIGKSRLAEEVAVVVEDRGERVLWGRSLPYEEQTPYRAFGQILRRAAGI